jgi:hypothetical protein
MCASAKYNDGSLKSTTRAIVDGMNKINKQEEEETKKKK